MEEAVLLTMENNTSRGAKGFSLGDWKQQANLLPRKRLSDISNLSISGLGDELVHEDQENGRTVSSIMVNDNITKLLKENNILMRVLAEKDAEVQKLRLMVGKISQQNWLLAHTHSQMLTEFNQGKDRLKAAQHELGCTSTALKVKSQEMEELKKCLNRQNKQMQKMNTQGGHLKPTDTAGDASQLASQKKTCPKNRKRPQRSLSLGPTSIANQVTTKEKDETQRTSLRRKSVSTKSFVPTEDLFEIEDVKFPICSIDKSGSKDGDHSLQPPIPSIPNIKTVKEEDQYDQSCSTQRQHEGIRRTSLGRPLRKAAEKVNSYKELPLKTKLRSE